MLRPAPYPESGPELRATPGGPRLAHGALGAYFQLDTPDEAALAAVNELVLSWMGEALTFSYGSAFGEIERFTPADLDLIAGYPALLQGRPAAQTGIAEVDELGRRMDAVAVDEFFVSVSGGTDPSQSSPYSYRFYAELPERPTEGSPSAYAMLRLSVPTSCPAEELRERVLSIAALLPLRWAVAGYVFSGPEHRPGGLVRKVIYPHARRYVGYDVEMPYTRLAVWHRYVRTVSWLTLLGPALQATLIEAGRPLEPRGGVSIHTVKRVLLHFEA